MSHSVSILTPSKVMNSRWMIACECGIEHEDVCGIYHLVRAYSALHLRNETGKGETAYIEHSYSRLAG